MNRSRQLMESSLLARNACQRIASIAVFSLFATGCKPMLELSKTAYIIGPENDIVQLDPVKNKEIPTAVQDASVLIATTMASNKKKFCSGTLIEDPNGEKAPRILTNHHCFAHVDDEGTVSQNWIPEACLQTRVYFGFRAGKTENIVTMNCKAGSLRSDYLGDLATFVLDGKLPDDVNTPVVISTEEQTPKDRRALIIHYPDVKENFAQLGTGKEQMPVASITDSNCEISGDFPTSEWKLDHTLPYSFKHTCDLVHGSSGSALLDRETFQLVGVNWGGIKINYNKEVKTTNVATKAAYVRAFLRGDAESFRSNVLVSMKNLDSRSGRAGNIRSGTEKSVTGSASGAVCGVVGVPVTGVSRSLSMLLLLGLPLGMAVRRQRR